MMQNKRLLLVVLTIILIMPSFLVDTALGNSTEKIETYLDGELASKDEVVYANLNSNGQLNEIYVVNILDVTNAGTIIDYGNYSSLKNLTDLSKIEQIVDIVRIDAPKGKFYYQGNMKDHGELPWDITISYLLEGKKVNPEELAGKEGHVQISIFTSANENVNPVFFENYLLQISLTLDPDIYSNIEIKGGMVANAGKNKQVTFTVMPEQQGELSIEADVIDFELQGIEIAAVPSSMSIDEPDIDEMTKDMRTLSDAIAELNDGVGKLKNGVSELNDGVISLRNGSEQYKNGMAEIDGASTDLIEASRSIEKALATISTSLSDDSGEIDLSELNNLPEGLMQMATGLDEMADGLTILRENYSVAYSTLDHAMEAIPEYAISEEEIHILYMSGADHNILDQLIETYSAAHIAKGTYSAVKKSFAAVDTTLQEMSEPIKEMGNTLTSIANELSSSLEGIDITNSIAQLYEGLATLSSNYGEFHAGLVNYTNGVGQLANSYNELHSGIVELSRGTGELEDGVDELQNGTKKLYESTSDLPTQIQEEIDRMIADFDKSDFESVSFVSSKIENVNSVQFVIKTASINKEEQETSTEPVEEEKGFLARLWDLFF